MKLQIFTIKKKFKKLYSNHTCLAVISLDSALKKNDNYYPQLFLKECKYIEKKELGIFMITGVIFGILLMRLFFL